MSHLLGIKDADWNCSLFHWSWVHCSLSVYEGNLTSDGADEGGSCHENSNQATMSKDSLLCFWRQLRGHWNRQSSKDETKNQTSQYQISPFQKLCSRWVCISATCFNWWADSRYFYQATQWESVSASQEEITWMVTSHKLDSKWGSVQIHYIVRLYKIQNFFFLYRSLCAHVRGSIRLFSPTGLYLHVLYVLLLLQGSYIRSRLRTNEPGTFYIRTRGAMSALCCPMSLLLLLLLFLNQLVRSGHRESR